jgi:hypothetical protein
MNDKNTVLTDKIDGANTKKRKIFCCMGFFSYLCSVQWNEGLAKAPHFQFYRLNKSQQPAVLWKSAARHI